MRSEPRLASTERTRTWGTEVLHFEVSTTQPCGSDTPVRRTSGWAIGNGWGWAMLLADKSVRPTRTGGHASPLLAGVGMFPCHRLSPTNKIRLSSCHGDSRVFSTAGRVISSLSAASIAVGRLPPPTNLRVGVKHPTLKSQRARFLGWGTRAGSGFRFTGTSSCRSMFTSCSANRNRTRWPMR